MVVSELAKQFQPDGWFTESTTAIQLRYNSVILGNKPYLVAHPTARKWLIAPIISGLTLQKSHL